MLIMSTLMFLYLKYKSHIIYFFSVVFIIFMITALIVREDKFGDLCIVSKPFFAIVFETEHIPDNFTPNISQ